MGNPSRRCDNALCQHIGMAQTGYALPLSICRPEVPGRSKCPRWEQKPLRSPIAKCLPRHDFSTAQLCPIKQILCAMHTLKATHDIRKTADLIGVDCRHSPLAAAHRTVTTDGAGDGYFSPQESAGVASRTTTSRGSSVNLSGRLTSMTSSARAASCQTGFNR